MKKYEAIVMGASAGGLNAYTQALSSIPKDFQLPIIVVQHCMEGEDSYLATHLKKHCHIRAVEAYDKQAIKSSTIYVCPPGYHILIESKNKIALSPDPPYNYSRPSIDLLFESAANIFRDKLICVLLTGANQDGTQGMQRVHELGGLCIVQDPNTAEADFMPKSAIDSVEVDHVLSLAEIGAWLTQQGKDNGDT